MSNLLLDTHAWVWSLFHIGGLTDVAAEAIDSAETIRISPASIYEIAQKVRIGKWAEMAEYAPVLPHLMDQQGALAAILTPEIALLAGSLDWHHRDPFDRLIAATAIVGGYDLISGDKAFDAVVSAGLRRIW